MAVFRKGAGAPTFFLTGAVEILSVTDPSQLLAQDVMAFVSDVKVEDSDRDELQEDILRDAFVFKALALRFCLRASRRAGFFLMALSRSCWPTGVEEAEWGKLEDVP